MLAQALAALIITVIIQSPGQIQADWEAMGHEENVLGWAQWQVPANGSDDTPLNCVIHVPPLTAGTINIWLHEIKHCQVGDFHP